MRKLSLRGTQPKGATMPDTIAEWIRGIRKKKAQTQQEAAEAIGVSRLRVAKWETGRARPGADSVILLASWSGSSVADVLHLCRAG